MTFNMLRIIWCCLFLIVLNNSCLPALPAASSSDHITHIVSYVDQRKEQQQRGNKNTDFDEFDFEDFRSNLSTIDGAGMRGALQQLFGRFVDNFDTNLERWQTFEEKGRDFPKNLFEHEMPGNQISDDLMAEQVNTLENGFGDNEQHESPRNASMWHRSKQSIPVLESVRHLVNSVRDGHLNNTEHVQRHRTLLGEMEQMPENSTSKAIETEGEREMVNKSSDLQFLEVLGSIGRRLWDFLTNVRQVFAASAASASGASSSSSSS